MLSVNPLRRIFTLFALSLALLAPSACSLQTASQMHQVTDTQLRQIGLPEVTSRNRQLFNQGLEQQIGSADIDTRYRLRYDISSAESESLAASGSSSNLKNTQMWVSYTLIENESGNTLTSGKVSATATSGTITSYYGQDISSRFASERLIRLLAERLYQKLQLYFLSVAT